jgi:hypothetical protein
MHLGICNRAHSANTMVANMRIAGAVNVFDVSTAAAAAAVFVASVPIFGPFRGKGSVSSGGVPNPQLGVQLWSVAQFHRVTIWRFSFVRVSNRAHYSC